MKSKVSVFLKSGHTVEINCELWEFKFDSNQDYTGYKFTGLDTGFQFGIDPKQIVGYISNTIFD